MCNTMRNTILENKTEIAIPKYTMMVHIAYCVVTAIQEILHLPNLSKLIGPMPYHVDNHSQ